MDVVDTVRVVGRRKWIVIPTLLLTVGLAALAMVSIPSEYTATSSVLIRGFSAAPSPVTPELLAAAMQDGSATDELRSAGATAPYSIRGNSDGLVLVEAQSSDPTEAVATVTAVLGQIEPRLTEEQDKFQVPEADRGSVNIVSTPVGATIQDGLYVATGAARLDGLDASSREIGAETLRDSLTEVLASAPVARELADSGGTAEYSFSFDRASPIIRIEAVATDEESAVVTATLLTDAAETQARALAGATDEEIRQPLTQTLVVPESASVSRKGPLRSVAAIAIVGIAFAICLAVAAEAYSQWRRESPGSGSWRADGERFPDQRRRDEGPLNGNGRPVEPSGAPATAERVQS